MVELKIRLRTVVYYVISVLFLLSGSIEWKYIVGFSFNRDAVKYLLCIFLVIGVFVNKYTFTIKEFYPPVIVVIIATIYVVVTRYNVQSFCFFVLMVLLYYFFALSLLKTAKYVDFLISFRNIMLVLAIVSLFCWFFGSVLNWLPGKTKVVYFWANNYQTGYTYLNLYYENIRQNQLLLGINLPRNCGIFTEVPGYVGYLLYAFLIQVFAVEKKEKLKSIIFLITILSTQSTKGLLVLVVFVLLRLIDLGYLKNNRKLLIVYMSLVLAGVAVALLAARTITVDKMSTGSYGTRLDDLGAALRTWLKHPLFGVGYLNNHAVVLNLTKFRPYDALSMGLPVLLAEGGIYLLFFYCAPSLMILKTPDKKQKKVYYSVIILLGINVFISNVWASNPYLFMLGSSLALLAMRDTRASATNPIASLNGNCSGAR